MANLICVRLNKGDAPSWGFRLQGGKDFGTPLVVQKVIGGSPAERAGLIAGDTVIKINNTDVLHLRHKDAQDVILRAGNAFDVAIQRGGSTWKPNVVPVGSISAVPSAAPLSNHISPVTHTSLAASKQDSIGAIGTGHNVSAKPYHQLNGGPKLVNKQYNSPLPIYSEQSIAETLSAQTEVLANGVLGVNFKKNEKSYDAANSEVFRMVQEADKEPKDYEPVIRSNFYATHSHAIGGQSTAVHTTPTADHISQEGTDSQQSEPDEKSSSAANQQITKCSDCDRVIVGVFVRIKDKNLHVECFKCATCGSSLKNVGYYNLNNKLYCDVHAKLAARSNPPAPNLQPITIPPGSKIPSGTISAALSSHSLPSPSSLSPNTNYSAAPYQPGSSYTTPKPFSSVTSPLSPIHTPISPTSTPYTESRGVQNIVWPPILNEPDIPTASPLYFPPPSQVQAHQKLLLDDTEIRINEKGITTEEEMSFINEFAKERNMSLCSSEAYNITGRRSAIECSETISDTIDRQILVESIVQSRPKSPPPIESKPRRTSGDVSVTFTISEAQLKQGTCQSITSDDYESKKGKVCPKGTLTHSAIGNVNASQGAYKSVSSEVSEIKELKTCLKETQSQSLASMYEKKIKVENTIPHKWESPMVAALTVASSKPYTNLAEAKEQHDTFSEIPTTTSHTPLASALVVAPAAPFTPASTSTLEPVSLPDETVPYFPPEHPIISQTKDTDDLKKEKKVVKKVYGKKKEEVDLLFQDLPTPPVEKISMLAALTTAPDRPYSPFNPDSTTPTTTFHEEVTSKTEKNTEIQKTKAVVATKTLEDYSFISHTSKPVLKTYVPFPNYQANEVSNTCTTVDEENQIREETSKSVNKHASEKSEVSKNVQSSENITNVCAGLPPMIQVVRSTFETSTDKVQMEMSCQYLGDSVPQRQIIEKHTTTDVNQQKAVEHRATEEHKTSSEIIHNKNKEDRKSTHATSQQKAIEKRALNEHKEQQKQFQNIVDMPSKSGLAAVVSSQVTESVLLQKATSNFESEGHSITTEQFHTSKKAHKEPLTVLKPGESSLSVPQISFQPVIEDACSSTTFSSRPGSLTPSMINKPAPVLPYYQASLVATECTPVGTNLFDPTSPAISRSPSPCIVRPPSPFATPSAALRPVSPAQGPPPNPLQSHKSVYEIKREGKVQDALAHIQTFIPQHQSKAYHARSESYKEEPPKEWKVLSTSDDKSITVRQSAKQADLFEASKLENTNVQCKREGNLQIQRKTHTTEEYEHQQKSKMIQIETLSSSTKKLEEKKATASLTGGQVAVGFHVTNPQPLKSPFRGADGASISETQSKIPKRVQQTDCGTKTNCPTVNSSASASVAPAKICPNKNVTKPSISQPNLGTGGGRQAGAIGVAPKRGRGVLNLAASPGSRVPLCAQCNANIRGPFITALGKIWCPDHFICATPSCRRPLHDLGFVEEHGQLYCEYCFEQYLAPPCSKCNTKIKGDCLKAIGKNYHPECFNCVYCGKLFGNSPFFLEDAQPYCETDWNELFTTKCFACGFPVEAGDRWVEALSNNYHSQCFNCTMCKKNLEGQSFFAKGGRPFCKNHAR